MVAHLALDFLHSRLPVRAPASRNQLGLDAEAAVSHPVENAVPSLVLLFGAAHDQHANLALRHDRPELHSLRFGLGERFEPTRQIRINGVIDPVAPDPVQHALRIIQSALCGRQAKKEIPKSAHGLQVLAQSLVTPGLGDAGVVYIPGRFVSGLVLQYFEKLPDARFLSSQHLQPVQRLASVWDLPVPQETAQCRPQVVCASVAGPVLLLASREQPLSDLGAMLQRAFARRQLVESLVAS